MQLITRGQDKKIISLIYRNSLFTILKKRFLNACIDLKKKKSLFQTINIHSTERKQKESHTYEALRKQNEKHNQTEKDYKNDVIFIGKKVNNCNIEYTLKSNSQDLL